MSSLIKKAVEKPILILIAVNILVGVFIFRDFGLTWDEPYFYSYGDALGYAYSPEEWFSGNFDLYHSYGISGDDHKNRGPAYLLLARGFVYGLEKLGPDSASAWHLVNFLFFQLGIYFLYRISTRWMSKPAAFFTSVFFSAQPLLWGQAFINPKDPPFLTFFLAAVCLGFEMVDAIAQNANNKTKKMLLASFCLGIATSIRILGPLAGLLIIFYSFSRVQSPQLHSFAAKFRAGLTTWFKVYLPRMLLFAAVAILVMIATWPYLWENPIRNFVKVIVFMADNPTHLPLLFQGVIYIAGELPRRYLPVMLAVTLTEPTWILFAVGLAYGYLKLRKRNRELVSLSLMLAWFLLLMAYVLLRKPAMYDGIRHFLFIVPVVFIFIGFAFQFFLEHVRSIWVRTGLVILLILPGVLGIIQLHPYEYAYYNSFVGGTSGVFRKYETEYWLTCYKQAVEALEEKTDRPVNLFVYREAYIADYYAKDNLKVYELRGNVSQVKKGDYLLVNSRTNEDRSMPFAKAKVIVKIKKGSALFCLVRQKR